MIVSKRKRVVEIDGQLCTGCGYAMMASAAAATRGDPLIVLPNLHDKGHDWPKLMSWESVRSSGKEEDGVVG